MTKNVLIFILIYVSLFSLHSCSDGAHASVWKANGVDFKKYKSYAWVAPGDTTLTMRQDDKLFAGTIYLYANEQLKQKGMVIVNSRPDVVFMFDTQVQDRTKYTQGPTLSVGVGFGGPGYYVGGSAPVAGGQLTATPFQEGRLIIEMFDTHSKELVWRGWAQKSLDYSTDLNKVIKYAVKDIFFRLPIKHKL